MCASNCNFVEIIFSLYQIKGAGVPKLTVRTFKYESALDLLCMWNVPRVLYGGKVFEDFVFHHVNVSELCGPRLTVKFSGLVKSHLKRKDTNVKKRIGKCLEYYREGFCCCFTTYLNKRP